MDPRLDERYLSWLYAKVERPGMPPYWQLLDHMFKTPFRWFVANDDNRAADGTALRRDFMFQHGMRELPEDWEGLECSILEMLIALSDRMAFNIDLPQEDCFWHIVDNLGLGASTDNDPIDPEAIEQVLERVNTRTYNSDGSGGLFPLKNPTRDQREVELFYQMYSYIRERNY